METEEIRHPAHAELMERATEPVLRAIVELHASVPIMIIGMSSVAYWTCEGCGHGEHAYGPADWPCPTVTLIANALGVEVPA
jgi:rubrerythrin